MIIEFVVPGEPVGKGRPRVSTAGGFPRLYTPQKTLHYEGLIAHEATLAMAGRPPIEGPCRLEIEIVCSVPASWSARKQRLALAGGVRPAKKPDFDNVLKALADGLNGVVWRDDVQAVEGSWTKRYGMVPGLRVRIQEIADVASTPAAASVPVPAAALEAADSLF